MDALEQKQQQKEQQQQQEEQQQQQQQQQQQKLREQLLRAEHDDTQHRDETKELGDTKEPGDLKKEQARMTFSKLVFSSKKSDNNDASSENAVPKNQPPYPTLKTLATPKPTPKSQPS